jgi:hypothetical protein
MDRSACGAGRIETFISAFHQTGNRRDHPVLRQKEPARLEHSAQNQSLKSAE